MTPFAQKPGLKGVRFVLDETWGSETSRIYAFYAVRFLLKKYTDTGAVPALYIRAKQGQTAKTEISFWPSLSPA